VWNAYYASTFNPARLKIGMMVSEMPKKYWRNMPETALVPDLIAAAQRRESGMIANAAPPAHEDAAKAIAALREEAAHCRRCPLWQPATQTVFGEGPVDARLMFVGEQPGDQEDMTGRPFVGPAGQLFDRALAEAGVDRDTAYVTNAVKHFKFVQRGKRRIHDKPNAGEISACRWWIDQERAIVRPALVVALGATAAQSLLGRGVTVHPSYLLRLPDAERREAEYAAFVADLRRIGERVAALAG